MHDRLAWLPTETGTTLHLLAEDYFDAAYFDDPWMTAGYRGVARCRSGGSQVIVAGYLPTPDPTLPLRRPRTRLDLVEHAAAEWEPIVAAITALATLGCEDQQRLRAWHDRWFDFYNIPQALPVGHLIEALATDDHPLAWPLAQAGASGITGLCQRCQGGET